MELRREEIQMMHVKSRATSQVTFDVDYNVPDVKPDVGRMIQNKGEVRMDEVRVNDGQTFLRGSLNVELLYVAEEEGKICSLSARLPLEETMNLTGLVSGDKVCLKWEIEDLSLHLIHSRKLNIKAIVTFYAVVDELAGVRLPVEVDDPEVSVKKKQMQLLSLAVHKKDTFRAKEDIVLTSNKPNISRMIWNDLEVRGTDLRPEENVIRVKGEIFAFILYEGDDEADPLQWLEYSIPFNGEVECGGCRAEMIPNIELSVVNQGVEVKPDADGEERVFSVDVVLELDMKLYQEEEHQVLLDVYTPLRQCIPHGKNTMLESLLVRNFSRCRLSDRIPVRETSGKILQLCHSRGSVKVDQTTIVENGIQVEGIVRMKILYITGDDAMPFYSMDAMLPFNHVVEARGIRPDCVYYLRTDLEQLSTTMLDGNEIEVKAAVSLNVLVLNCLEERIIERVEEQPLDMETIRTMPGITVYIVKSGDTLWDIAKGFYTTVEEICALNELEETQVRPGQPLLLVKKMEA
jgi:hypothetical protein